VSRVKKEFEKSVRLFRAFSGHDPKFVDDYRITIPSVAMQVGICTGVMYKARRDGKVEEYLHEFTGRSRPMLGVSPDGSQLILLGGDYTFTDHGIVDRG